MTSTEPKTIEVTEEAPETVETPQPEAWEKEILVPIRELVVKAYLKGRQRQQALAMSRLGGLANTGDGLNELAKELDMLKTK